MDELHETYFVKGLVAKLILEGVTDISLKDGKHRPAFGRVLKYLQERVDSSNREEEGYSTLIRMKVALKTSNQGSYDRFKGCLSSLQDTGFVEWFYPYDWFGGIRLSASKEDAEYVLKEYFDPFQFELINGAASAYLETEEAC
jgi:hypothetical protein